MDRSLANTVGGEQQTKPLLVASRYVALHRADQAEAGTVSGGCDIQVYVPFRARGQVTLPRAVCEALDIDDHGWVRLSLLEAGRALLEHVPPHIPESVILRGAAALPTGPVGDEQIWPPPPPAGPAAGPH